MMVAVDGHSAGGEAAVKRRILLKNNVMNRPVIGRRLTVDGFRRVLRRKILIERTTQEDIDHLDPAADAKNRLVLFQCRLEHHAFQSIPSRANLYGSVDGSLMIIRRRDVRATRKQKAVAESCKPFNILLILCKRKYERHSAGVADSVHIFRQHTDILFFIIP